MSNLQTNHLKTFGNKLRIRVCSLWVQDHKLLLIKHKAIGGKGYWWAPPGGGMEFGECAEQALTRELLEETGIQATHYEFAFVHEFISPPLHAIELFFHVTQAHGTVVLGHDPELHTEHQLLEEVRFMSIQDIAAIPNDCKHNVLVDLSDFTELLQKKGYSIFNPQGI